MTLAAGTDHRIPDLFRSCGHETPFSDQKGASKSGIPCSASATHHIFGQTYLFTNSVQGNMQLRNEQYTQYITPWTSGYFRNLHCTFCSCMFPWFHAPKRRFWKAEQKVGTVFSKHFTMVRRPNIALTRRVTPLKSASKRHTQIKSMWRTQIARFQDPWLKDRGRVYVSTQIWGMLHISFKSFLSFHMSTRNDLKEMCNIPQIWVLTHANLNSLSRGSWNRAICARHMGDELVFLGCYDLL